ncbi:MAG: polysaccharide biosynthesis C-terminal domain-containing protein, partial [Candidatus Micrarchaeota archaeon]|nr:polysaccharide biosynthesis C-terminal domain-containing protein [Candidatus Micrarchaeota archaeon]
LQKSSLIIVSADLFFSMLWGAAYSALIGLGNGKGAAISSTTISVLQFGFGAGLVLLGFGVNGGLSGLLIGDAIGFVLMAIFIASSMKKLDITALPMPDRAGVYDNLKFSASLGTYNFITGGVVSFATLYLGVYASSSVIGDFGASLKALGVLTLVFGTLSSILIQAFSTVLREHKDGAEVAARYNKALDYSLLLNLPIIVFTGVFAKQIISIFLHQFTGAPFYIFLIAIGTALNVINYFMSSFLTASGRAKELLKYVFVSVIIQFAAVLVLIPIYQAIGAIASVYFIGSIANLFLFSSAIRKYFGIRLQKVKILSMYVASLVLGMIISAVHLVPNSYAQLLIGIVAVVLLYPPLLVVFKGVDSGTLDEVAGHVKGLPLMGKLMYWLSRYTSIFTKFFNTA